MGLASFQDFCSLKSFNFHIGTETPWVFIKIYYHLDLHLLWVLMFVVLHIHAMISILTAWSTVMEAIGKLFLDSQGWSYSAQVGMRIKLRLFVRAVSALDHWAFFPPTYTNILKNRFFKLLTLITVIFKSLRNFWFTKTLRKSPFPSNCMPFTCLCFLYFLLIYEAVLIISIMWDFLLDNHNCSDLKVAAAKLMKKRAVKPYEIIYVTMFIWKCCIIKTEMCRN